MAKVIITIEDSEDGKVEMFTQFDEGMKPSDPMTPAMAFAFKMLETASEFADEAAK